jgi:hypothetical protein
MLAEETVGAGRPDGLFAVVDNRVEERTGPSLSMIWRLPPQVTGGVTIDAAGYSH